MLFYFRVDSSNDLGAGHTYRCLSLALALRKKNQSCIFISRKYDSNLFDTIKCEGFDIKVIDNEFNSSTFKINSNNSNAYNLNDAEETIRLIDNKDSFLIVDHYFLDLSWELSISKHVRYIFVIDDLIKRKHYCNFYLDQNYGRDKDLYKDYLPVNCKKFIGPKFILMRDDFKKINYEKAIGNSIFLSFGGLDIFQLIIPTLQIIEDINVDGIREINVIVNNSCPHLDQLSNFIEKSKLNINLILNPINLKKLIADSKFAIIAAGSTYWECSVLGTPAIIVATSENQRLLTNALKGKNLAIIVDGFENYIKFKSEIIKSINLLLNDTEMLATISSNILKLTDGRGAEIIANELVSL